MFSWLTNAWRVPELRHRVLFTALILFLGYGWPFLVGWTALGLGFARAHEGRHNHES